MTMVGVLKAAKFVTCAWLARRSRITPLVLCATLTADDADGDRQLWHPRRTCSIRRAGRPKAGEELGSSEALCRSRN